MSAGKILLLILGVLIIVWSVGLLIAGGALLWVNSALMDSEGFLTTRTIDLEQDSHAIVTAPADIDLGVEWMWDWVPLVTFKIEGSNDDPSKQIFIGIADESYLSTYLNDVAYDEITGFSFYPYRVSYTNHQGDSEPAAPTSETFWRASVHDAGTQTLEWELEAGRYSLVLMNDDGSAGVDLSVLFGVKIPPVFGIAIGLIVGGTIALIIGILMVFFAIRRPQTSQTTPTISEVRADQET